MRKVEDLRKKQNILVNYIIAIIAGLISYFAKKKFSVIFAWTTVIVCVLSGLVLQK